MTTAADATPQTEVTPPVDLDAGIMSALDFGVEAVNAGLKPAPLQDDSGNPPESEEQKTERVAAETATAEALKNETPEQKTEREAAEAAKAAETPEQKTAREAKEAADAAKKLDPVNDPIPPTAAVRTRERIQTLANMVKERDTRLEENTKLFQEIASTGVSPDNFAQVLTTLRLFNSPNIDDKRQAMVFLQAQVAGLAKDVGEVLPGQDALEGHDDLKAAITAGTITQPHADEIAKARNRAAAGTQQTTQVQQAQEAQAQQLEQERTNARSALNAIGATLSTLDPDYATKAPLIIAKLGPVFANTHPSKWVQLFQDEYKTMAKPAAAAVVPTTPAKPAGQPLRPNKQPAGGGGAPASKSMAEALEAGLASMRG